MPHIALALAGSFHLLHLLLNEFIVHEVERLMYEDSTRELMLNLMNAQASELSDSSFADTLGPDFLSNTDLFPGSLTIRQSSRIS
jgi:hypothetical protein